MKCERCDQEMRVAGTLPTLELKALGMYPSDRMTIGVVRTSFATLIADATGELATIPIIVPERFLPHNLHRIPGLPISAYPLINGVAVSLSATGAAPTAFNFQLYYRDAADIDHLVHAGRSGVFMEETIISPLAPVCPATNIGEKPAVFGTWVLRGALTIGASTGLTVTVHANLGVLYGAPK